MNRSETIRNRALAFLLATPALARPAQAQTGLLNMLGVQAETQYEFSQVKRRGLTSTGRGRLSTNYVLTLRRPFLPTSTLVSDLSFSASETGDINARQNTRGWTLNMYANQPKYMMNGRINHSKYNTSSGLFASSSGYTTDYNLGMFLRQPAYPVVNLQFQRNVSGASFAGSSGGFTTTTWLMGSAYDLKPLRFSVDRIQQTLGSPGAPNIKTTRQTSAVTLNHALLPGLTLTGELSKSGTDVSFASSDTSTDTNRRVIRLSATPLRSVVADVALTSQSVDQKFGQVTGGNRDKSISWSVRSEVLPGLSMDIADQKQSLSGAAFLGIRDTQSRIRSMSMAARLAEGTIFNVSKTRTTYDVDEASYQSDQDSLQSALQTSLTRTTDLSVNYGKIRSSTEAANRYDSSFQSISLRDRTSPRLSVGATYRRTNVRSTASTGDAYSQNGNSADLDMLWQPNYDVGINMRLSLQDNDGSNSFRSLAPSGNVRWQVDRSTNLTANYALQSFRQYDPSNTLLYGQETRGLSVRMTHNFSNGSNLDIAYGYQGSNISDIQWRKQLLVSFTMVP